jgi:uncharacterized protein (DUF2249 family)
VVTYLLGEHGVLYALLDRVEELAAHADLQALRAYRDLLTEGIRSHAAVEDELLFEPLERTSPQAEAVVRGMRTMHDDGACGLGRAGSGGLPAFSRAGPCGRPTRSCAEEVRGMSRLGEAFRSLPLVEGHLAEAEQDALLTAMHEQPAAVSGAREKVLDVRRLAPPQRHPLIFATFQALGPGEGFELVNDHDPKPLYYQFAAELPGQFTWEYLVQGPEVWRVRVGKSPA